MGAGASTKAEAMERAPQENALFSEEAWAALEKDADGRVANEVLAAAATKYRVDTGETAHRSTMSEAIGQNGLNCVEGFFQLCHAAEGDGPSTLADATDVVADEALSDAERLARTVARRAKIKAKAEAAMRTLEALGADDRAERHNQGDLDHYSEAAMQAREALRDDPRICRELNRWWRGAVAHDDRDKNACLDRDEYETFYRRLVAMVDADGDLEKAEIETALAADFAADAGEDGRVTRDEFENSVFELADQWTASTDADEYVEFLTLGYAKVFSDMDTADKLLFPTEWTPYLKCATQLTAMPVNAATQLVCHCLAIYGEQAGSESLAALVVTELKAKSKNEKQLKKQVKAFSRRLEKASQRADFDDFLNLFARLVGCYTRSGRVKAMPREGAAFVARVFHSGLQPLSVEAHQVLPSRFKAPMQRRVASGKLSGSVGYCGLEPLLKWLPSNLYKAAGVKDPQLKASVEKLIKTLARPSEDLLRAAGLDPVGDYKTKDLVEAPVVLQVAANLWHAVHWDVLENISKASATAAADAKRRVTDRHGSAKALEANSP